MLLPSKFFRPWCWSEMTTSAFILVHLLVLVSMVSSIDPYRFEVKNPVGRLNRMRDPFENGIRLGYKIGSRVGYNEERNATLEVEYKGGLRNLTAQLDSLASRFIGRVAYWRAATAAAKKAFEISVREGFITALKVSIRAGLRIPADAGAKMAALKCVSVAAMTGMEVGGSIASEFLMNKDVGTLQSDFFIKLGKDQGSYAGMKMGKKIGVYVGRKAAEEAYRRAITRGGQLERAKFHLDEYVAGAKIGFDYGLTIGKQAASLAKNNSQAPTILPLPKRLSSKKRYRFTELKGFEKEIIPPLTKEKLAELENIRQHEPLQGTLTGSYTVIKETKNLWRLKQNSTKTYKLSVDVKGYKMGDVAYLNLNGTLDNNRRVYGSIITRDIFKKKLPVSSPNA